MATIVCLSSEELEPLLPLAVAIEAVKEAYVLQATGGGRLLPLVRERLAPDAMFGIKTGFIPGDAMAGPEGAHGVSALGSGDGARGAEPDGGVLGLKAGGSWKGNKRRGMEAHQATVVLLDPRTGRPRAFMDGNHITTIRTGAAGAVGCELFAPAAARVLAVIGTGVQGVVQTEAALHARPGITEVRCFNPHGEVAERYRRAFEERVALRVCASAAEAVEGADIVVTATPSTEPLVFREQLKAHVHVNAVGSDSAGKRELDPAVLRAAEVFVDAPAQSRTIGELQGMDDVDCVAVGDVIRGAHPGRQRPGLTVFDSTGISLQDLTTAWRAYRLAVEQGIGARLEW